MDPKLPEEGRETGEDSWVGGSASGCLASSYLWRPGKGPGMTAGFYVGHLWVLQSQDKPIHHWEALLAPRTGPGGYAW